MWYTTEYEKSHFYPGTHPRRTPPGPKRIAFVRCLRLTTLPDLAGISARGTSPSDSPPAWLRRSDGPQRHQRVQCNRTCRAARRLFTPPPLENHLHRARMPALTGTLTSQSARLWQRMWRLDLKAGCSGQLRARDHCHKGVHRKRASCSQTTQNQLEACQTLDQQPRPAVSAKKNARDRLIAWASHQPTWAIGFQDEVGWKKGDPDPKALACYGVLW